MRSVPERGTSRAGTRPPVTSTNAWVRSRHGPPPQGDACVVVNQESVVLGLLRAKELQGDPDQRIEEAMRPGPSTNRPYVSIEKMAAIMSEHDLPNCPVTTSDGRLVGLLVREDAQRAAHELHREGDPDA